MLRVLTFLAIPFILTDYAQNFNENNYSYWELLCRCVMLKFKAVLSESRCVLKI